MADPVVAASSRDKRELTDLLQSKRILTIAKFAICAAILLAMVGVIVRNADDIADANVKLRPASAAISVGFLLLYYFSMIGIWHLITIMFGIDLPYRRTQRAWTYSMFGKYLPGKVWLVAGRFYYYSREGKNSSVIAAAFLTDGAIQMATSCAVVLLCMFGFGVDVAGFADGLAVDPVVLSVILLCVFFILVHPRIMTPALNAIRRLRGKEPLQLSLKAWHAYVLLILGVLIRGIGGLGIFFLVNALWTLEWDHYFFLTGTMALSGVLGTLAVFAPGGLGVREASIAYCLSFIMPSGVAATIGLAARVWMVCTELILFGMVAFLSRGLKTDSRPDER